jgi:hypothetical protein
LIDKSVIQPITAQQFEVAKSVVGNMSKKSHMFLKAWEKNCSSKEKHKCARDMLGFSF